MKRKTTLLQITPIIICWEIWRNWWAIKFGDKKLNLTNMKIQINWIIQAATKKAYPKYKLTWPWPRICEEVEKSQLWIGRLLCQPSPGCVKINTDGSFFQATGKAGIGGAVRNYNGGLIMAFSLSLQCSSNNFAEAFVAKEGINWCVKQV